MASSRRAFLGTVTAASAVALAGCLVRGEDRHGHRGQILVDGSNTVLPHAAVVSEEFAWRNNRVDIPVRGSGTGAGFQRFCEGETDVQNASRQILDDEVAICENAGVEYLRLETALDGLAVFVNPENDWCDCLTVEELAALWRSGSEIETWRELQSVSDRSFEEEWPDEPIDRYGRDPASGTFDYFTEALTGEIGDIRSDYSASADTNVIVRGVRGSRYAMGFGGAGFYFENEDDLALVGVDDGDGCAVPIRESVESGTYTPLTRPLFTYVRVDSLERPAVRAFLRFYFEEIDGEATDAEIVEPGETLTWTQWAARRVGFYGIPDETVETEAARLETAIAEVLE